MASIKIALALSLLVACKTETSLEDYACPQEGTKLTYESFGQAFIAQQCQSCHGQSGSGRKGAPSGYDFATIADVRAYRSRIFARAAADNVTMPPGPVDPPEVERSKLAEWLACGAP